MRDWLKQRSAQLALFPLKLEDAFLYLFRRLAAFARKLSSKLSTIKGADSSLPPQL